MRRFWTAIYAITAASHLPFALGLAFALARLGAPRPGLLAAAVTVLPVLALRGRLARMRPDRPVSPLRLALVEEPYFVHWFAAVLSVVFFLPAALAAVLAGAPVAAAGLAAYLAALPVSLYGVVVRRRWVRVRTLDVPIAGLPPGFDGYRIAQLSDLHIGGLWPRARALRWVRMVNALDADLVALTGDYVTNGEAFHHDIAAVLSSMRGRDGVVAVMGNHDYFGDGDALVALLRARGVSVLCNEHRTLVRGGATVTLAGVDDRWSRRADVDRALADRDPSVPLLVLAHDPLLFPALGRRGAALVLSGHTHWGQIAVPFFSTRLNISRLSYRHHAGLYREGQASLYVSPGLGTTGPPLRLGAPPEITVLRLRTALAPLAPRAEAPAAAAE